MYILLQYSRKKGYVCSADYSGKEKILLYHKKLWAESLIWEVDHKQIFVKDMGSYEENEVLGFFVFSQ